MNVNPRQCECGQPDCTYCRQRENARKWREANRERLKEQNRAYYQANKERYAQHYWGQREAKLEYARQHREANQDRVNAYDRARYERDKDKRKAVAQSWQERNPDKVRAASTAYKCRKRGAPLTPTARKYVKILHRDPCSYCGAPCEHIDHIVPLSAGGLSTSDNLTAACASCNSGKKNRSLLHYLLDERTDAELAQAA